MGDNIAWHLMYLVHLLCHIDHKDGSYCILFEAESFFMYDLEKSAARVECQGIPHA